MIASVWKKDLFFKLYSSGTTISTASRCQSGRDREFGIPESVLVVKTTVIARSASRKRTAADLPAGAAARRPAATAAARRPRRLADLPHPDPGRRRVGRAGVS